MPNVHSKVDFETIKQVLDNNLKLEYSIEACCENVAKVPLKKGIYFWFMRHAAYAVLSKYTTVSQMKTVYQRNMDGEVFDLVYLGTAGTGKKGNSNLSERLKWHICAEHSSNAIRSGTLSTLRAGLGALLADDLIHINTESDVNGFMSNNMRVSWIAYEGNDVANIDSNETMFIKGIMPLLNIKNNPKATKRAEMNPTRAFRLRRLSVYAKTRMRLRLIGESPEIMAEESNPTKNAISYVDQILTEENGCVEYTLSKYQNIAEVTRGITLPKGKVKFHIYDSNNPDIIFDGWKSSGTNYIYKYFARGHGNTANRKRATLINEWMQENEIEEITVRIFRI